MIELRCTGTSDEKGILLSCEGLGNLTQDQVMGLLDMIRDAVGFLNENRQYPEDNNLEYHAERAMYATDKLYQECSEDRYVPEEERRCSLESYAAASLVLFYARKCELKNEVARSGGHDDSSR